MCNGAGIVPEAKKRNMGYSRSYIHAFSGSGYFPTAEVKATEWSAIAHIGHPTAEQRVMQFNGHYYIGQPVCRSSTWWKIPISEWADFKLHFNKVFKKSLT